MHFSGNLLEWFADKHPDYIATLKELARKGQVEFFSGGFYEPILTLIPEKDAQEQIGMLSDWLEKNLAYKPLGGWIAERVWEPKLPQILSASGVEYGVIDDTQFSITSRDMQSEKSAGAEIDRLTGYYITEEAGQKLAIFPGSEKLRYYMPFKLPQETINYFKERMYREEGATISFGDDIEKFGLWPGTHQWVYKENWLENFFSALEENSSWLKTMTFKEYFTGHKPTARVYLSCSSYREMQEWSLGYYRNFMIKYPEANNMHKKMVYLSNKIRRQEVYLKKKSEDLDKAKLHILMSQANDAYWHGVFGGVYLYHLRSSLYSNMVEAQKFLDRLGNVKKEAETEAIDFDLDGRQELIVNTETFNLHLRPEEGATLSCLDYKPKSCNLVDTLSRKPERYHKKLKQLAEEKKNQSSDSSQLASIHDKWQVKEAGLDSLLFYDRMPRYCFREYFLSTDTAFEDFLKNRFSERGDFAEGAYDYKVKAKGKDLEVIFSRRGKVNDQLVGMSKALSAKGADLLGAYTLHNQDQENTLDILFGIEFNLSVHDADLADKKELSALNSLEINDSWHQLKLNFSFDGKANLWVFPVETISESESGIEKTYQELCCFFWWRINLSPQGKWQNSLQLSIK